jgi:hypothetical protein
MREIMYDQNSILIVSGLFLCMLLSIEIGFRIRSRHRKQTIATEAITQANAVLVSMLGLLALLLAFTFSAALQRYDNRSQAVVVEANAIGTTYLRARLLPREMHDEAQALLRPPRQEKLKFRSIPPGFSLLQHRRSRALAA